MGNIILNLQLACNNVHNLPTKKSFLRWLQAILPIYRKYVEITIRLVDKVESYKLNLTYRGKNRATNVLSFPFEGPLQINLPLIGDLVICKQVVEHEAKQKKKKLEAYWAHMVIHGSLHLLGYNHLTDKEILEMESLETEVMQKLGYSDPYLSDKRTK